MDNIETKNFIKKPILIEAFQAEYDCEIKTPQGVLKAKKGDWIVKNIDGNQYPIEQHLFFDLYTSADEAFHDVSFNEFILLTELSNLINEESGEVKEVEVPLYIRKSIIDVVRDFKEFRVIHLKPKSLPRPDDNWIKIKNSFGQIISILQEVKNP